MAERIKPDSLCEEPLSASRQLEWVRTPDIGGSRYRDTIKPVPLETFLMEFSVMDRVQLQFIKDNYLLTSLIPISGNGTEFEGTSDEENNGFRFGPKDPTKPTPSLSGSVSFK